MSARAVAALVVLMAAGVAIGGQLTGPSESGSPPGAPLPAAQGAGLTDVPPPAAQPSEPGALRIRWRDSTPLGSPSAGSLAGGVQLPIEGRDFFTWDPVSRTWGNRPWRRFGADAPMRAVLQVIREHRAANPDAPRVGIGDISRPRGGDFGPRFGLPGHASHQNGLDFDFYYPRLDRLERAPVRVSQIDLRLSQDLVDRFVAIGVEKVFVGPGTGLSGPSAIVVPLIHHDNHLHVRFFSRGAPGG